MQRQEDVCEFNPSLFLDGNELQDSQGYSMRHCLKKTDPKKKRDLIISPFINFSKNIFIFLNYFFAWVFCLHVCKCTECVPGTSGGQERVTAKKKAK